MKKKNLLIFLYPILMVNTALFSQSFRKLYKVDNQTHSSLIENADSTYTTNVGQQAVFDNNGTLIKLRLPYYYPGDCWLQMCDRLDAEQILWAGSYGDSCDQGLHSHLYCLITDKMLNHKKQKYFDLNARCILQPFHLEVIVNNNIVITGRGYNPPPIPNASLKQKNAFAMAIDSTLETVIWSKYFSMKGACNFAKQLPDKSFILGMNSDSLGGCLTKLDSSGNILWCKSYLRPKGIFHDAVVNSDGSLMIVGFTDSIKHTLPGPYPSWFQTKLLCMKVDTGGTILWCKGYDDTHPYHWRVGLAYIRKLFDGNYLIGAEKISNLNNNPHIGGHAQLIKIDTNGDTIYTRGYGSPYRQTDLVNFIQTSDSCYLIAGYFIGASPWMFGGSFLYKTDTAGFTTCGGNFTDPVTVTPLFYSDSLIPLTSSDGASVHDAFAIDTTFYVATLDDCILLGIASQSNNNLGNSPYPNPTNGKFTIDVNSNKKLPDYVTVYDSKGIIILQKPIATQKDLQLDLSKYGKGIYLVKVREGDNESSSKVVVE